MKKIIVLIIALMPLGLMAQKFNQKTIDPKKNNEMLIGYCNRDGFKTINSNFDSAYRAEYALYKPMQNVLDQLKPKLKGIKITLVMGSWCGDSKEWVPRFYKVMDQVGFKYKRLTLICVDRSKQAPTTNVATLKVDLVPTFIFYRKGVELGRIVEMPMDILEKEILKIVLK